MRTIYGQQIEKKCMYKKYIEVGIITDFIFIKSLTL